MPSQPRHRASPAPRHRRVLAPAPPSPTRLIQTDELPAGVDALVSADAKTVIVRAGLPKSERLAAVRAALAAAGRRGCWLLGPIGLWRRLAHAPLAIQAVACTAPVVVPGPAHPRLPVRPAAVVRAPRRRAAVVSPGPADGRAAQSQHVTVIQPPPAITAHRPAPSPSVAPAPAPTPTPSPSPYQPLPSVSVSVPVPSPAPSTCITLPGTTICV
jgi:hypothetical protein